MLPTITSPVGVMTVLVGVAAFFFWIHRFTGWKLFDYIIPLIWIYATPILLSNLGLLPFQSPAYDLLRQVGLPLFIVLMLIKVDVLGAVRIMGKGVYVMLIGTLGIMVGAVVAYVTGVSLGWLPADSFRAFGTLSGSWIGGTGNMNAAWAGLDGTSNDLTMALAADNLVYIVWLPLLLVSKAFADWFNRKMKVPEGRIEAMDAAAEEARVEDKPADMVGLLYLAFIALAVTWVSAWLASVLPAVQLGGETVISEGTWTILLVTTIALLLSRTRARELPASQPIGMGLIYVFVASIGAKAQLAGIDWSQIGFFVLLAYLWIFIHGVFILFGARIFRVDVHTLAIASAANVGGAASAPVVAAHHRESLVPASILMALIGYAIGNYLAIFTGRLLQQLGGML